jgi:RNAse (barnase) inhibitor barstar
VSTNNAIASLLEAGKGGVWFVPGTSDAKAAKSAARKAGFAFFHVEGRNIERKEQLLNALATAMRFPQSFGNNWDALEESLIDLETDGDGFLVCYDHIDGLLDAHPDQFETFIEILGDAVESWKEDGTPMIVLLCGARAPKGVARLKASSG